MENSTIFDDVFQTIKEKMPELVIPLINEAFGTTYALDAPILRGENEHHTANGKVITDSYLRMEKFPAFLCIIFTWRQPERLYEPEVSVSRWTVSELQGASATNAMVFTGRIVGKESGDVAAILHYSL